jgi:3-oxoacyl-[acyl-carrier-protein] synthase-3
VINNLPCLTLNFSGEEIVMAVRRTVISGTGCFIPSNIINNRHFEEHEFYDDKNQLITTPQTEIVNKFKSITGIEDRCYANIDMTASQMAAIAARQAIADSGIDAETLDQLIVANNFGDIKKDTIQNDFLPALSSRVKHDLGIKNARCVAYDIIFGCPGWLQGVIHADAFFKAGIAQKALVVGTETLSRVLDLHDRDSMIFADGAGASVLEYQEVDEASGPGILSTSALSHCVDESQYIYFGKSNQPESDEHIRYLKMKGRKVYEYAMLHVPTAMKDCLDKSGVDIDDLKKIFIHQANEKMDEAITARFYKLYGKSSFPEFIMPMSIHDLGNSSVATIPTLYDQVRRGLKDNHTLAAGDVVLFASVGAGMNINAVCYRI